MGSPLHKPMTLSMLAFIEVVCEPLTGASHREEQQSASGFYEKSVPDVL